MTTERQLLEQARGALNAALPLAEAEWGQCAADLPKAPPSTSSTPGPWTVGGGTGRLNQVEIEPAIGCAYGAGEEVIANARLMAAAPDLLAALMALFDADMDQMLIWDDQRGAVAMARAAVKKATS